MTPGDEKQHFRHVLFLAFIEAEKLLKQLGRFAMYTGRRRLRRIYSMGMVCRVRSSEEHLKALLKGDGHKTSRESVEKTFLNHPHSMGSAEKLGA